MKKLHLLCNAHLDPAWLWRWNEGLAEALSTFRVAADFCEKYDGFVFNHNESLLYEWVEEYEPALFKRIQKLVAEGKWHIMGGWYLQPDCVMTSGQSLLSQIELGQTYFAEKFNVSPTTAINFDPFGHTRGLVQILKATGYDSYLFLRPQHMSGDFWWVGYDDSKIMAHGASDWYNSPKGKALEKVKGFVNNPDGSSLCLWGVGNHGGGPSAIDLQNITEYMKTAPVEIVHSTPEAYFAETFGTTGEVKMRAESLIPSMVGCYTSMVRVKQAHRRLENAISLTEKVMSIADMTADIDYDSETLKKAKKALAFCQFHDILPGSAVKAVEEDSLKTLAFGEELAEKLYTKAFFKLCEGQPAAEGKVIPVMVCNPHPYPIHGEFEIGFMLEDQNRNEDEATLSTVYDTNGQVLLSQNEKPDCTFNMDWIQKVSFCAEIAPSSISRFNCHLRVTKKSDTPKKIYDDERITVENDRMQAVINRRTGLIERYAIDGKVLVENSGVLEVYNDNEDPWGMTVCGFTDLAGQFRLMSDADANDFIGYPAETTPNVRVVEDGDVRIKVQSFWEYRSSKAMVEYTIPKNGTYIDTNVVLYMQEPNKMVKYRFDTAFTGKPYGQSAFGKEPMYENGDESVFHKWCAIDSEDTSLTIYNNGTYGGSFTPQSIKLSLLRTPVYSAHPIDDRQIAPHNRFLEHIDMGERRFFFRLAPAEDRERQAQIFNEAPRPLSFFPSGSGELKTSALAIDNPLVMLDSLKKTDSGYRLTLYNASEQPQTATVRLFALGKELEVHLGKCELKFVDISV